MKRLTLALFAIAITDVADAADISRKDFARCSAINGDLARLECFDELARTEQTDKPISATPEIDGGGQWEVRTAVNPIDDSKTVTMLLTADSGSSRWNEPIYVIARCKSNKTDFYVSWNAFLADEVTVMSRIGKHPAISSEWESSTDSKSTFHPAPVKFLKEMLGEDSLVLQITPYSESPVTAIFNIAGLINAIKPLRETCSW